MVANGVDPSRWQHSDDERARLIELGDDLVRRGPKWHGALGAVEPAERSRALDLLGFEHQVVYSSFCAPLFEIDDAALRYGAYRAHNRAMAGFCEGDDRLHGVAICDLDEPERSLVELDVALDMGLGLVWIPARAPGAERPVIPTTIRSGRGWPSTAFPSCCTSAAAACRSAVSGWTTGGRGPSSSAAPRSSARRTSWSCTTRRLGSCRCSCSTACSNGTAACTAARSRWARDGCLTCCGDSITPPAIWSRSEPRLATFERTPTEQACAQLRFTPYPFEDIARIAAESDPRLYLFSSDYPHAEGGRDPLGRFERSWAGTAATDDAIAGFFSINAAGWLGVEQPA